MVTSSSSVASMFEGPPLRQHQVFINFRGVELRNSFISHLERALQDDDINYYIDRNEVPSQSIEILFDRIDESDIALAVFSKRYSESKWCLDELERIMKNVAAKKLRVIPIFYNVTVDEVKNQKGEFGINFYNIHHGETTKMVAWKEALKSAPKKMALILTNFRSESDFIVKIVESVKEVIAIIEGREGANMLSRNISSVSSRGNASSRDIREPEATLPWYRMEQCLEQLEEKLNFDCKETQIIGIVGMPGIGKTTLAKKHLEKWKHMFVTNKNEIFEGFREKSNEHDWVKNILVDAQRKEMSKVLIILDDVSDKQQLEFLRMNREETIKKGSKIMITTRDKGSIEGLAHDTYIIPGLNDKEALELFTYHAFADHTSIEEFVEMSKKFVDYAGGNPLALEELGKEICGTDEDHWQKRLETLPHRCNENIRRNLKISYDDLTGKQKHAFLDIACFFRSEEEDYVRVLLDSYDTNSGEAAREVRDLADKFLISISAGRIEMHNILCTMGKEIDSSVENNLGKSRLWDFEDACRALLFKEGTNHARGIFLDTSKIPKGISLQKTALMEMPNLRYVKIFDSRCPRQCEVVECKVYLPEKLEFRNLNEIRYLHWLKFPLKKLPADFNPENLIDLRLPYSKITRVWKGIKGIPKLKWVDLSHSTNLIDLSALSKATSLRRLNLEDCTMLVELSGVVENMKSLAFLNLKGCTKLLSLPQMESLTSLKTLILSDCSNFKEFQVISENLEYLHLDGTAIQGLPPTIQNLGRLIVLNLKDCKKLESLPDCLDKLKALEELILSGCSMLSSFPEVNEIMENLQILLLDGTLIEDLPNLLLQCGNNSINLQRNQPRMNRLALLRRLCLRGNDKISSLQSGISQLYHLKEIDLKHCKNLESLPTLPPNLQCLDAHDCVSLKTVGTPLALLLPLTEQVPSSFIFTNCEKLEHAAKNEIISYAHNKSRLISDALNRHNKGLAFEALVSTCFPGSEVPAWFNHRASGAVLKPELPGHWSERGFVGIALCAIVSFQDYKVQNNNLMVECNCECNNSSSFNCNVGGLSEVSDEQSTIKSTHVFIRYTSWLNMNTFSEEVRKKGCLGPTEASIKFKVTDGTCEAENCEVLKCGFSLVCESDNGSWDANVDASPMVSESDHGSLDANIDASPMVSESDHGSLDTYVDASPMVSESDHGSLDAYVDASESFHGCSDAYTDAILVSESDHGFSDANIDATPVAEEVRESESRFLGNLRRSLQF
ncbi:Inactive disease resistance protein RPS4 [Cardamine amara subsp. amara]|uniref:ADP-ribosyl cyclase/cyclic ADP-ribose hydrolase n=1 Tax=Cardamine amara subsp. amara TaxID=228776 RepID=A0ABD1B651_CARAN